MPRPNFQQYISAHPDKVLVLDGGQGTELENRGIDVANPVWSTVPFISQDFWSDKSSSDRAIVRGMFEDFLAAGAEILMTTTYQTSFKSVGENTPIKTLDEYNTLLDRIVQFSRNCIGEEKFLIGCIGPWGAHVCAEFNGDYGPAPQEIDYYGYFKPQLDNFFANDNLDLVGFETIPNIHELRAILSWDESILSKPFYIGLSVHENGKLRDGSSMHDVAQLIRDRGDRLNKNLTLIGINCVSFNHSAGIIEEIHKELPDMPLIAYPNSGEVYDTVKKVWNPNSNPQFTWDAVVKRYLDAGARIVGGCCRTTPDDIRQIADAVKKYAA